MKTEEIAKKLGLIASLTMTGISVAVGFTVGDELGGNILMIGMFISFGVGTKVEDCIMQAHKEDIKSKEQVPRIYRKGFVEDIDLGAKPKKLEIPIIKNGRQATTCRPGKFIK